MAAKCFFFLCCLSCASALRLLQARSSLSTLQSLHEHGCASQENERIHPLVSLIAEWFPKHNFDPYPIALTAWAAYRFGGIGMSFGKENHTFDDDLDFILVENGKKSINVTFAAATVQAFASEAQQLLKVKTHVIMTPSAIYARSKDWYEKISSGILLPSDSMPVPSPDDVLWHLAVFVHTKTEVTDVVGPLSERVSKYFGSTAKTTSLATMLDFWIDVSGQMLNKQEENAVGKPLLLAGVEFNPPWSNEVYSMSFKEVACTDWGKTMGDHGNDTDINNFCNGEPRFCDFFRPAFSGYDLRLFSHDFNEKQVQKTFEVCAETLEQQGYRSFAACT